MITYSVSSELDYVLKMKARLSSYSVVLNYTTFIIELSVHSTCLFFLSPLPSDCLPPSPLPLHKFLISD